MKRVVAVARSVKQLIQAENSKRNAALQTLQPGAYVRGPAKPSALRKCHPRSFKSLERAESRVFLRPSAAGRLTSWRSLATTFRLSRPQPTPCSRRPARRAATSASSQRVWFSWCGRVAALAEGRAGRAGLLRPTRLGGSPHGPAGLTCATSGRRPWPVVGLDTPGRRW